MVERTQHPVRVLFLCTGNSARSQLADAWLRALGGERFAVFSAGTEATDVRPLAIRAMAELGIDIGGQASKTLDRGTRRPGVPMLRVIGPIAKATS